MKSIINITNGNYLNSYLKEKFPNKLFVPFSEAMIEGNPVLPIFSHSFIQERIHTHQVEEKDYRMNMHDFLEFTKHLHKYSSITLWFGKDMFCQLNVLTILAYLQQENFNHPIYLNLIDEDTYELIQEMVVPKDDYLFIYQKVMIENQRVDCQCECLNNGIQDYLNITNEIISFIYANRSSSYDELFHLLLEKTKKYGLGDTQIHKFINNFRG